jgi:hypothetical protein
MTPNGFGVTEGKTRKNSNKIKEHKMNLKKQVIVIAVALAATICLAWGQDGQSLRAINNQTLQGTWRVTRTAIDCQTREPLFSFPSTMTFNQGGTYTGYGVAPGIETPATKSPEYGYWLNSHGPRTYTIRVLAYTYEPDGTFAGWVEVTSAAQVAIGGNAFTSEDTLKVFDADGNLLFEPCGTTTGTRFE